jgi:leucyl aminopeptidase (aminopeptidase T)
MTYPSAQDSDRLARAVLRQRLGVKPKENVTIETYPSSVPWAAGFVRESRRIGARPLVLYEDERSYWSAVEEGRASLLGAPGEHEWAALEDSDVYVYFWGPEDLARRAHLSEKDAEKAVAFNRRWYQLAHKSGVRGARMGIARATEPNSRFFGIPLGRWRERLVDASLQDPSRLRPPANRVRSAFERGRSVRIRHPNGTDLTLALAGRKATVAIGDLTPEDRKSPFGSMTNVPDGSVYVAVDEKTADGTFVANRPNTTSFDGPVEDGRFVFRHGRLVSSSFGRGGRFFRRAYRAAGSGRELPAFVELGVAAGLEGLPLLEEAEAGAVTVGIGRNAPYGGTTDVDFLAYLTLAGAEVSVDGRRLARGGRVAL